MATHWKEWENKIGRIFANIGFTKIENPEKPESLQPRTYCMERLNPEMQVDVFVRVDATKWVLIECRDRRNATIKKWLHEVAGRASHRQAIIRRATKNKNHQVVGVAATSLQELDSSIQAAAEDTGIALWHHGVVDYLIAISKGAGSQVQELVLQRCGLRKKHYEPIRLQVQRWPHSAETWFTGYVSPLEIAHAAFVYQRGQGFGETAYQRFLKPQRINEIAEFVKSGKVFPNALVLALPSGSKYPRGNANLSLITLSIPGKPEAIKIIDGQHRFFGALASGKNPKLLCSFVDADDLDQALMFAKVNGKQVSVNKSQLVSLFGIPGFAAKIASGANEKEQSKIDREEAIYRSLERINQKGPLQGKLNFYSGRPAADTIPFKTPYDTLLAISKTEQSGFDAINGTASDRGRAFGERIANFLNAWSKILGPESFDDPEHWMSATMISAIIYTYPDCRWNAGRSEVDIWLKRKEHISWNPRPETYRGAGGARALAKALVKKLGVRSQFL
jgi:DGQHR domain-containing protein